MNDTSAPTPKHSRRQLWLSLVVPRPSKGNTLDRWNIPILKWLRTLLCGFGGCTTRMGLTLGPKSPKNPHPPTKKVWGTERRP